MQEGSAVQMIRNYHRDGTPYPEGNDGLLQCARDMGKRELHIVKQDTLWNGIFVSTVWLGFDHQFGKGRPLIFESMVFMHTGKHLGKDLDQKRYSTEAEAIEGHKKLVREWSHPCFVCLLSEYWWREIRWWFELKFVLFRRRSKK